MDATTPGIAIRSKNAVDLGPLLTVEQGLEQATSPPRIAQDESEGDRHCEAQKSHR